MSDTVNIIHRPSDEEVKQVELDIAAIIKEHPIPLGYLHGKPVYEIGKDTADKDFIPTIFN